MKACKLTPYRSKKLCFVLLMEMKLGQEAFVMPTIITPTIASDTVVWLGLQLDGLVDNNDG